MRPGWPVPASPAAEIVRYWFRCRRCNVYQPETYDHGITPLAPACDECGGEGMRLASLETWGWLGLWKRVHVEVFA